MKKYIFIAVALLAMGVCSCKKESKTDPEPTPQDPVVTSDSLNIKIRIYATIDQMKYVNYKAFFTPNGETEKELQLTETVEFDSRLDNALHRALTFMRYPQDSILIYNFDMKVKKGSQSLRFEGTAKDTVMPETIALMKGYCFAVKRNTLYFDEVPEVSLATGVYTNKLDAFYSSKNSIGPFIFDLNGKIF